MSGPRRAVVSSFLRSTRGSVLGGDTYRRMRIWDLTLECGHRVERSVRYSGPSLRRYGGHKTHDASAALPPRPTARCGDCALLQREAVEG